MIILVGLTGGIACGKSTVSQLLHDEHGIQIIDADAIVRSLQEPGSACVRRIAARWPSCVDATTMTLDRVALGELVFKDPSARRQLAAIMNGPIFRAIMWAIWRAWLAGLTSSRRIVVLDAPTLFETRLFTYVISSAVVVACSEERQIERLRARNVLSTEAALSRIRAQMPLDQKRQLADVVIENDGKDLDDLSGLRADVEACLAKVRAGSGWRLDALFGTIVFAIVLSVEVAIGVVAHKLRS